MLSVVLIVPAAVVDKANALAGAMGWGNPSYTVPLATDGTVTHWGLHTWAQPAFLEMVQRAAQGQKPEALATFPSEDFAAVIGSLIMSVQADVAGHFDAVCAANNLHLMEE
jgi:hypothetical protein